MIDYARLESFIGYGNLSGRLWALGMEEGTAGASDLGANLEARKTLMPVMDLAVAHDLEHLAWPIESQNSFPSCWLNISRIALALDGVAEWPDLQRAKDYTRHRLGRSGGDTLLLELLPLPKRSAASWPDEYRAHYGSRADYQRQVLPQRQQALR